MRPMVGLALGAALLTAACTRPSTSAAPPAVDDAPSPSTTSTADATTPTPSTTTVTSTTVSPPTVTTVVTTETTEPPTTGTPGTAATTSTTTTTTTITTTTTSTWPRTVTMAFSGDILPHSPLWRRAARNAGVTEGDGRDADRHDFGPMLAGLAEIHDTVDVAVCHLETPIAPAGEEYSTSPFYGVPPGIADAIAAAGFDRCSTASNHAADRGPAGIDRTVDVLESAGVEQAGMARTPGEIAPTVFAANGIRISHLSYTWSYNGLALPEGQEWRSALIDPERIVRDARIARRAGADVVIVSLHWGEEGVSAPSGYQRRVAEELTASGELDLIVGHHAHVLQPIERVNDRWVLFGLGNVLSNLPTSNRWPAASQDAAVVTVAITVGERGDVVVERPVVHPTWVDHDAGWVVRLVASELARDDLGAGQRGRLERSLARTKEVVGEFVPATASTEPSFTELRD